MTATLERELDRPRRAHVRRGKLRSCGNVLWQNAATRGGLVFVLASFAVNLSNFVFHLVVSRLLGPSSYGALGALLNVTSVLSVPLGAVQVTVAQSIARQPDPTATPPLGRLLRISGVAAIVGLALWLAATPTIDAFFHLHTPSDTIGVGLWLIPVLPGAVLEGVLIGQRRFRVTAVGQLVGALSRLAAGAVLIELGFGALGGIVATVVASGVVLVIYSGALRTALRGRGRFVPRAGDAVLSTIALGGAAMLTTIDAWLARHFLASHAAGLFVAAATAGNIALFLPGAVTLVYFPRLAASHGRGREARQALARATALVALLGLGAAAGMALLPGLVINVLFGHAFLAGRTAIGTVAAADALIGVAGCFLYFQVARSSRLALAAWPACALALGLAAAFHGSLETLALDMLVASGALVVGLGVPTALAALRSLADETSSLPRVALLLEEAELDLTLVVPCRNVGSDRLAAHLSRICDTLLEAGVSFELVPVSDGSTDGSEAAFARVPEDLVRPIVWTENRGKGEALRAGLAAGRGRYLGFIDGDGDLPADLLAGFVEVTRREQPEVVVGSKRHPQAEVDYPFVRRCYSTGYQLLTRVLFGIGVRDTQTGIKLIRRDVVAEVLPRMVEKRFAFDLELLAVAHRLGYRHVAELPVRIGERFPSTISPVAVWRMLQDTLATFWRLRVLRFYDPPLVDPRPAFERRDAGLAERLRRGERLRILVCNWRDLAHPFAGGAEVYTHRVARAWVAEGHEVTWFCAAVKGRPSSEQVDGITIVRRGGRLSVYRAARRYYDRLGRGRFDLVIDEVNTKPFQAGSWVRDAPVVALVHQVAREVWNYEVPLPLALLGRYVLEPRWLRRLRNVPVLTVSESSAASLAGYGLSDLTVVPEGMDPIERVVVEREAVPTVAFVGRLAPNKRPDHAVEAFRRLRERLPNARLWMIGDGPMAAELAKVAPAGVELLGRLSEAEKHERLARAHCLVATAAREGWGLTVTEAAQAGTPAIAYDVAGLRDSVAASGGMVVPATPQALADALSERLPAWLAEGPPPVQPGGVRPWHEVAERLLDSATARVEARATTAARGDDVAVVWRRALGPLGVVCDRQAWSVAGIAALIAIAPLTELSQTKLADLLAGVAVSCLTLALLGTLAEAARYPLIAPGFDREGHSTAVTTLDVPASSGTDRMLLHRLSARGRRAATWRPWVPVSGVGLFASAIVQPFVSHSTVVRDQPVPAAGAAWLHQLTVAFSARAPETPGALIGVLDLPLGVTGSILKALGGSLALDERIWVTALFAAAGMAMASLLTVLEFQPWACAVGGSVYIFSPYVFAMSGLRLSYLAAMALAPGIVAWLLYAVRPDTGCVRPRRRPSAWVLPAALALGIIATSPPLLLACIVVTAGAFGLVVWLNGRRVLRDRFGHFAVSGGALVAACSFWAVPLGRVLSSSAIIATAAHRHWQWAGRRETLANSLWLNTAWNWRQRTAFPYAATFDHFPLVLWKYAVPLACFAVLGISSHKVQSYQSQRRLRLLTAAAGLALTVVVVATGTGEPGAPIFALLTALPYGWLTEDPGRFLFLAGAAYAVLVAAGVDHLQLRDRADERGQSRLRGDAARCLHTAAVPILVTLLVVAPALPFANGAGVRVDRPTARTFVTGSEGVNGLLRTGAE